MTKLMLSIIVTVLGMLAKPAAAHNDDAFNVNVAAVANYPDWMKSLPDNTNITDISFPGTHDTLSGCIPGSACHAIGLFDYTRTQSMTLQQQLDSGIRGIDIRIMYQKVVNGKLVHCNKEEPICFFPIYHGSMYQNYRFETDVLEVLKKFLEDHPTETIIMRLMRESNESPIGMGPHLARVLDKYSSMILQISCGLKGVILGRRKNPEPCHARGKVVILERATNITGRTKSYSGDYVRTLEIENHYQVPTNLYLYSHWVKKAIFFHNASTRSDTSKIYANHLGGSEIAFPYFVASGHLGSSANDEFRLWTGLMTPPDWMFPDFPRINCIWLLERYCSIYNEGVNTLTKNLLTSKYKGKYVGLVSADFPGAGLIGAVINANADVDIVALSKNEPPSATLSQQQYIAFEGKPITFDASGSTDPNEDDLNYHWELLNAPHCVRDIGDGGAAIQAYANALDMFTKNNPQYTGASAVAAAFANSNEGKAAVAAFKATPLNLEQAKYVCTDNLMGNLMGKVQVTVSDSLGEEDVATADLIIQNVAPTVSVTGTEIDENKEATVEISIFDPGVLDTFTVDIDWGDGENLSNMPLGKSATGHQSFSIPHKYLDDDPTGSPQDTYTVKVTVVDKDGGVGKGETTVVVSNIPPTLEVAGMSNEAENAISAPGDVNYALVGLELKASVRFADEGAQDTHTLRFKWGDETVDQFFHLTPTLSSPFEARHVFVAAGSFEMVVEVDDDDTGHATASSPILVVDACDGLRHVSTSVERLATAMLANPFIPTRTAKYVLNALAVLQGKEKDMGEGGAIEKCEKGQAKAEKKQHEFGKSLKKISDAMQYLEKAQPDHTVSYASEAELICSQLVLVAKAAAVEVYNMALSIARTNEKHKQGLADYLEAMTEGDFFLGNLGKDDESKDLDKDDESKGSGKGKSRTPSNGILAVSKYREAMNALYIKKSYFRKPSSKSSDS